MQNPEFIYGTAWKENQTASLVKDALASGFTAIDTANQRKHYHEVGVGEALQEFFAAGGERQSIWLQSKYTLERGQDHRLPYDKDAPLDEQVRQSFASSLEHLHTDYLDSYLIHGPFNHDGGLSEDDILVWSAFEELHAAGKVRQIGVSNFQPAQLVELCEKAKVKPAWVQNRCYAQSRWDHATRTVCREHSVVYQGFSLLTANPFVLEDDQVMSLAEKYDATPAQLVFRFAQQVGMVPLTGTTKTAHMKTDLACNRFTLTDDEVHAFENIAAAQENLL